MVRTDNTTLKSDSGRNKHYFVIQYRQLPDSGAHASYIYFLFFLCAIGKQNIGFFYNFAETIKRTENFVNLVNQWK